MSEGQHELCRLDARVRQLGATLAELGWDAALHQLVLDLPHANQRLAHVGQMTEAAAHKVLNQVDAAQPHCQAAAAQAAELAGRLDLLAGHPDLGVGEARAALAEAAAALMYQQQVLDGQASALGSILLAQDFQDLSGQVIKKVMATIGQAQGQVQQLHQLLVQGMAGLPARL